MAMTAPESKAENTPERPDAEFLKNLVSYFGFDYSNLEALEATVDPEKLKAAAQSVLSDPYFKQRIDPATLKLFVAEGNAIPVSCKTSSAEGAFAVNANGLLPDAAFRALCPMDIFALGKPSYPLMACNIHVRSTGVYFAIGASHVLDHASVKEILRRILARYEDPEVIFPSLISQPADEFAYPGHANIPKDPEYAIPGRVQQARDLTSVIKQYLESEALQVGFDRDELKRLATCASTKDIAVTVNDVLSALIAYAYEKPVRTVMDARRFFKKPVEHFVGTFMHVVRPQLVSHTADLQEKIIDLASQQRVAIRSVTHKDYVRHLQQLGLVLAFQGQKALGAHVVSRTITVSSHQMGPEGLVFKKCEPTQQFLTGLVAVNDKELPQLQGSAYITGSYSHPVVCMPLTPRALRRLREAADACGLLKIAVTSPFREGEILSTQDFSYKVQAVEELVEHPKVAASVCAVTAALVVGASAAIVQLLF